MNANKFILASLLTAGTAAGVMAQASYSGYFLENYTHRYQLNPALTDNSGRKSFVAFPALGNLNVGMQGNLCANAILYNVDGKTVLFTNPGVSAAQALDKFHDKNKLGANVEMDILAAGFTAFGGM